jgi:hypothetical protein
MITRRLNEAFKRTVLNEPFRNGTCATVARDKASCETVSLDLRSQISDLRIWTTD